MTSLKWEDLKGTKVAIHCPTQELADRVGKYTTQKWGYDKAWWKCYRADTHLCCNSDHGYCGKSYYLKRGGWTLIEAEDFLRANEQSTIVNDYSIF